MKKTPIIIDTDPGIDDSIAIITLAGSDNVEIKAITTPHGNVGLEGTTENALKLCELLNLDCPVAKGANKPMIVPAKGASDVHGSNGLGGHILPDPVKKPEEKQLGHTAEILAGKIQEQRENEENKNTEEAGVQQGVETIVASQVAKVEDNNEDSKDKQADDNVKESAVAETLNLSEETTKEESEIKENTVAENKDVKSEPEVQYKGKIIYPPKTSATVVRKNKQAIAPNIKPIRVPARKPKYARR